MTSAWSITAAVNPPRAAFLDFPLGHTSGPPERPAEQLEIIRDALGLFESVEESGTIVALDHDWGTNPPNAQLATFTNGSLLLEGNFTDFFLTIPPSGAGAYEGNIAGVGGTSASICDGLTDCAYTFGGAFNRDVGAQIPVGYDLQIDGTLAVDSTVPAAKTSFGAIKSLFSN